MTLILCEAGDAAAFWAAERLRQRGLPADILLDTALGDVVRWEHRIESGVTSIRIALADGRLLSSDEPLPILNRLGGVPLAKLYASAGHDYGYAAQELFAFYLSWLNAWPAIVINRPTPQGLCGNSRHGSAWVALGEAAGLETRGWRQGSDDPPEHGWIVEPAEAIAFVVEQQVVLPPALPASLENPCRKFAALADTALIGIGFVRPAHGRWLMISASPRPDLSLGGEPLIDVLAEALAA